MGLIPASLATLVGAFPVIVSLSSLMPTQCLRRREGTAGGNSLSLRTFIGKSSLDYISRRGMAGSNILYLCRCCWIKALWKCLIWNFTTLIWAYWSWKWIQDCPVLQSNHEPVVPAEGRTTWWTPHLRCMQGLVQDRRRSWRGWVPEQVPATLLWQWGARGCEPVPYNSYISALWCLCNPGLSVRRIEAQPEQDLLGIWGLVLLA